MKKTLVISAWAPPITGGSPTIISKLLSRFPKGSYIFFTCEKEKFDGALSGNWLPTRYYFAGDEKFEIKFPKIMPTKKHLTQRISKQSLLLQRVLRPVYELREATGKIFRLKKQVVKIINSEKPDLLLGTSDDGIFLITSYLAAKESKKPLYIHLLDLYAHNNYSLIKKVLALYFEGRILRYADKVFVTNEKTKSYYEKLYGIHPIVIKHITKIPDIVTAKEVSENPLILYTGAVYWAQNDAVYNLVQALKHIPEARLKIYSGTTKSQLARLGIWSDQISLSFSKDTEIQEEQSKADILFLPMGFNTPAQEIVRTAAPGKMPEYLVSGVPILVHAAPDDYIAEYATKEGWGLVVDKNDPDVLAAGIKKLLTNKALRERLVKRAFEVAKTYHDQDKVIPFYMSHFQ